MTRFVLDSSVERFGVAVVGGSPLKLFRLTAAGSSVVDRLANGDDIAPSALVDRMLDAGAIHPQHDGSPFTTTDVTIVVPTLGDPGHVPPGAIVVDDGSDPPVPGATLRLDPNQGPAVARNAGTDLVTTPLVAFVDRDIELDDDWLEPLLPHFSDPAVALVAPRVRATDGAGIARYEADHSPLDLGPEPARIRAGTRVSYVPAAAIVCRTDAVRNIGGFDEGLRFGEDVDFVWRLDEAGWRCRYEPTSVVRHATRSNWRAWVRQRIGYGSSAAPLAKRHPGALAPVRTSGWSAASWLLGATGRPALGFTVAAASAAALVPKLPDVPARRAFGLASLGNLRAGDQIAEAVRRVWWPLLALGAIRSRAARRVLLVALATARNPLVVADDVAYSIGVWQGMIRERTLEPLIPAITSWPGRRSTPETAPE